MASIRGQQDTTEASGGGQQIPLSRLRYGGSAHSSGFAIYSAARDRYQDVILRTGLPTGTPQQALDTACTIHLNRARPRTRTLTPVPNPRRTYGVTHLAITVRRPTPDHRCGQGPGRLGPRG